MPNKSSICKARDTNLRFVWHGMVTILRIVSAAHLRFVSKMRTLRYEHVKIISLKTKKSKKIFQTKLKGIVDLKINRLKLQVKK